MSEQSNLTFPSKKTGSVECLGQTFASEEARREHFLKLLAAKLKDPEFRKIEGFPIGKDEDILALSDPPYYTACPNPWIGDFIKAHGTPYDPKKAYHREPFAGDVSEGKSHPIYNAHYYHTKVPHRAIMKFILHYTEPGEVIFDGFAGTGMAGVAAQLCGDRAEVQELGYRVRDDGVILDEEGKHFSKLGARRTILNDLSPAATFISYNYNTPVDVDAFESEAKRILKEVEDDLEWMYQTHHEDGSVRRIEATIWSELFSCPQCGGQIVFLTEALDPKSKKVRESFPCPHCNAHLTKDAMERVFSVIGDSKLGSQRRTIKYQPCIIKYKVGRASADKVPDSADLAVIDRITALPLPLAIPSDRFPIERMYHGTRIEPKGFTHVHHFYMPRIAHTLAALWQKTSSIPDRRIGLLLRFWLDSQFVNLSVQNRYRPEVSFPYNPLGGVYYIPGMISEASPFTAYTNKLKRLAAAFSAIRPLLGSCMIETASATASSIPSGSLDYVFTDPPFGENIFYGDMNFLTESWHRVLTHTATEAIIDNPKGKGLAEYQQLMLACFKEYYRILKPGRWITVEFSNSKASIWNSIQTALQEAGFVVANVAALDKQMRSFRSVTSPTAVKQDLVISGYKPNGGLEERFATRGETEEGVWDFIKTHLHNLPVVKARGGQLEIIAERDPRILYDRMVAFYVGHSTPVPLSSAEFQLGLAERFPQRDEMFFLPEQVNEYDKKRQQMEGIGQLSIFVEDEKSAVAWLRNKLKDKPQTQQDIHTDFMQQLSASWKKWETRPELRGLLDQNFLRYEGEGEVPSQIHSYLSTQFKELRNLAKDHQQLRTKAKDRWFVPDPKKNIDVEMVRTKKLLEEFWGYLPAGYSPAALNPNRGDSLPGMTVPVPKIPKGKKLKELRSEAVRAGFKHCYQKKDYQTILVVAELLPESVIQEDEALQMYYDTAVTRTGGD